MEQGEGETRRSLGECREPGRLDSEPGQQWKDPGLPPQGQKLGTKLHWVWGWGRNDYRSDFSRSLPSNLLQPETGELVRHPPPITNPKQTPQADLLILREVVGAERGTGLNFFLPQPPSLLLR